jgi:hypothetical protein
MDFTCLRLKSEPPFTQQLWVMAHIKEDVPVIQISETPISLTYSGKSHGLGPDLQLNLSAVTILCFEDLSVND